MTTSEPMPWGGAQEMSAWEALMWRSEGDPRTRSTGIVLEILDSEPTWERFVEEHEQAVRLIPRLRERVVAPHLPLVQPVWSADPHFDIQHHVRRTRLAAPGTHRDLLDLCEDLIRRPLDPARPPWEAILVTDLEGGRAAYLFKVHHSLSDGMGLMQLQALTHRRTADRTENLFERARVGAGTITPGALLAGRVRQGVATAPRVGAKGVVSILRYAGKVAADPAARTQGGLEYVRSLRRMLTPPDTGRSPLMSNTGVASRFLTLDIPLADLKAAAKAADSSLNDAYVSAVLGGLRRYHEAHDAVVDSIPIGMPVSMRTADQPGGGNRFAGVRLAVPLAEPDPAVRMARIRAAVRQVRGERALGFLEQLSPVLTRLPAPAIIELSAGLTTSTDLNISNIPGNPDPLYLAGTRVLGTYPLGPRPGIGLMATMVTYAGTCCLGFNIDARSFPDLDVLERALEEGFTEVLALAAPRTMGSAARGAATSSKVEQA